MNERAGEYNRLTYPRTGLFRKCKLAVFVKFLSIYKNVLILSGHPETALDQQITSAIDINMTFPTH